MHVLWIEVPAAISTNALAGIVDDFSPGTEGRYYLIHTDLLVARAEALTEAWMRLGYRPEVYDKVTRYTIGTAHEHFLAFWLSTGRAPGQTPNPLLHVVGDDRGITTERLSPEPVITEISIDEYIEWRLGSS
jgi:hypothetical protein